MHARALVPSVVPRGEAHKIRPRLYPQLAGSVAGNVKHNIMVLLHFTMRMIRRPIGAENIHGSVKVREKRLCRAAWRKGSAFPKAAPLPNLSPRLEGRAFQPREINLAVRAGKPEAFRLAARRSRSEMSPGRLWRGPERILQGRGRWVSMTRREKNSHKGDRIFVDHDAINEKKRAHELIERLAPSQVSAVLHLLAVMTDPVAHSLASAPVDDEPLTEDEAREIADARASLDRGEGIAHEKVLADFGLTWEDFARLGRTRVDPAKPVR